MLLYRIRKDAFNYLRANEHDVPSLLPAGSGKIYIMLIGHEIYKVYISIEVKKRCTEKENRVMLTIGQSK